QAPAVVARGDPCLGEEAVVDEPGLAEAPQDREDDLFLEPPAQQGTFELGARARVVGEHAQTQPPGLGLGVLAGRAAVPARRIRFGGLLMDAARITHRRRAPWWSSWCAWPWTWPGPAGIPPWFPPRPRLPSGPPRNRPPRWARPSSP